MAYSTLQVIRVASLPSAPGADWNSTMLVTFFGGANPTPVSARRLMGSISTAAHTESVRSGPRVRLRSA